MESTTAHSGPADDQSVGQLLAIAGILGLSGKKQVDRATPALPEQAREHQARPVAAGALGVTALVALWLIRRR